MRDPRGPIGVFDSGVGGLSVLRALLEALPAESYYYLADSAKCPYGSRSAEEIRRLSAGIARHLIDRGAKALVVACNTASAAALASLREAFPAVPVIGMVPAVKPAAERTRTGVVGVLATPATFGGRLFTEVVERHAHGARVLSQTCHGLVERIEAGDLDSPATVGLLRSYVEPLLEAGADTLVLGCTHYPFVIPALRSIVGDGVELVEPSEAIARQTARVLAREGLVAPAGAVPTRTYATSGPTGALEESVARLLGIACRAVSLRWRNGDLSEA